MPKSILVIVEGESDEVRFLKYLFKNCYKTVDYKVYPYRTNIHVLAQELFNNYSDFEDDEIDVRLVLASMETNEEKRTMLLNKYTDIYMIFDFDPHHDHPHFDTVKRMLKYFNDSTCQGKLYINYPMMQSYKHFPKLPDNDFRYRRVNMCQIKEYKRVVGAESKFTDLSLYDYKTFYSLAVHHLKKMTMILSGEYVLPVCNDYISASTVSVYDFQLNMFQDMEEVYVLNTSIFALIDFSPTKFFAFIERHGTDLFV